MQSACGDHTVSMRAPKALSGYRNAKKWGRGHHWNSPVLNSVARVQSCHLAPASSRISKNRTRSSKSVTSRGRGAWSCPHFDCGPPTGPPRRQYRCRAVRPHSSRRLRISRGSSRASLMPVTQRSSALASGSSAFRSPMRSLRQTLWGLSLLRLDCDEAEAPMALAHAAVVSNNNWK